MRRSCNLLNIPSIDSVSQDQDHGTHSNLSMVSDEGCDENPGHETAPSSKRHACV